MNNTQLWLRTLLLLALILIAALLIGFVIDQIAITLVFALMFLLLVNYLHLYRLSQWLDNSKKSAAPNGYGIWLYIFERIHTIGRRNRRKQKQLNMQMRSFRQGSEALPDAMVIVDKNARISWCNRHACSQLGLQVPKDKGRKIVKIIHHSLFLEFLHKGDYSYPIEVPAPNNPHHIFEYRIIPFEDDQLLIMARDISRSSRLEKMRKDFVANVSHELKTPLTVINGYLEVLESSAENASPIVDKAFAEMGSQTKRMQELIEDLLILSRIESSSDRVFENAIDMQTMFAQMEVQASTLNKDKGHTIVFSVDTTLRIYGVESEIRSACSNLLFNAIHYTRPGGHIKVKFKRKSGGAYFAVVDNGDGIENKHLRRLTERFYRIEKGRSRSTGGSGLGLSIVKHALKHHNTHLNIRSKVGKGSKFSFILPNELIVSDKQIKQDVLNV